MNNVSLKPAADIDKLANATDTKETKVPKQRRQYLAHRVQDAGLELPQVLPVLISQAENKDEADFVRSLVEVKEPAEAAKPEGKTTGIGGSKFVAEDAPADHS